MTGLLKTKQQQQQIVMHKDQNNPKLLYSKYVVRIVKVIYTINYMKSEETVVL